MSQEFQLLIHQQRMGVDLDKAFSNIERRLPIQDFSIAVSAIKISREVGGNLVDVMDTLAETPCIPTICQHPLFLRSGEPH